MSDRKRRRLGAISSSVATLSSGPQLGSSVALPTAAVVDKSADKAVGVVLPPAHTHCYSGDTRVAVVHVTDPETSSLVIKGRFAWHHARVDVNGTLTSGFSFCGYINAKASAPLKPGTLVALERATPAYETYKRNGSMVRLNTHKSNPVKATKLNDASMLPESTALVDMSSEWQGLQLPAFVFLSNINALFNSASFIEAMHTSDVFFQNKPRLPELEIGADGVSVGTSASKPSASPQLNRYVIPVNFGGTKKHDDLVKVGGIAFPATGGQSNRPIVITLCRTDNDVIPPVYVNVFKNTLVEVGFSSEDEHDLYDDFRTNKFVLYITAYVGRDHASRTTGQPIEFTVDAISLPPVVPDEDSHLMLKSSMLYKGLLNSACNSQAYASKQASFAKARTLLGWSSPITLLAAQMHDCIAIGKEDIAAALRPFAAPAVAGSDVLGPEHRRLLIDAFERMSDDDISTAIAKADKSNAFEKYTTTEASKKMLEMISCMSSDEANMPTVAQAFAAFLFTRLLESAPSACNSGDGIPVNVLTRMEIVTVPMVYTGGDACVADVGDDDDESGGVSGGGEEVADAGVPVAGDDAGVPDAGDDD